MNIIPEMIEAAAKAIAQETYRRGMALIQGHPDAPDRFRALAKTALTAALSAAWRPIETAPKDETFFLAWADDGHMNVVCFEQPTDENPNHCWWSTEGMRFHRDLFTRFQHLPPPPIIHKSDCAMNNAPALEPGLCNCGAEESR